MNNVQVDYAILVEVMQEKISAQINQIVALEARIKAYDIALTEALNNASEKLHDKKTITRKKSVNTDEDNGTF
jgi:hypothetical protein